MYTEGSNGLRILLYSLSPFRIREVESLIWAINQNSSVVQQIWDGFYYKEETFLNKHKYHDFGKKRHKVFPFW
jgi:hypothetical protein